MDSLRKARDWLTSRSKGVQAALAVGVALVVGVLLAAAAGGGGSDLDKGDAAQTEAQARATQTLPTEKLKIRKLPEVAGGRGDETKEKPAQREKIKLVERPLEESEARVRRIFKREVSATSRAGLLTAELQKVDCGGGTCEVRYLSDGPGAGKIIEQTGPILRELFSNPNVKSATVFADPGGPDLQAGGQKGAKPVVVHCDRSALETVRDIGLNSGPFVRQACEVSAEEREGR